MRATPCGSYCSSWRRRQLPPWILPNRYRQNRINEEKREQWPDISKWSTNSLILKLQIMLSLKLTPRYSALHKRQTWRQQSTWKCFRVIHSAIIVFVIITTSWKYSSGSFMDRLDIVYTNNEARRKMLQYTTLQVKWGLWHACNTDHVLRTQHAIQLSWTTPVETQMIGVVVGSRKQSPTSILTGRQYSGQNRSPHPSYW